MLAVPVVGIREKDYGIGWMRGPEGYMEYVEY